MGKCDCLDIPPRAPPIPFRAVNPVHAHLSLPHCDTSLRLDLCGFTEAPINFSRLCVSLLLYWSLWILAVAAEWLNRLTGLSTSDTHGWKKEKQNGVDRIGWKYQKQFFFLPHVMFFC